MPAHDILSDTVTVGGVVYIIHPMDKCGPDMPVNLDHTKWWHNSAGL